MPASDAADSTPSAVTAEAANVDLKTGLEPGNLAPTFTATDLDGNTVDLTARARESKYILLDFWASWCGPCRAEFPHLRKLHQTYKDRGLQIIGVCSDTDRDTAARAAEQAELDYAHVYHADANQQSVTDLYQVSGIPQTYILDSNLKIVAKGLRGTALERRIEKLFVRAELAELKPNDTIVVAAEKAQLKVVNDVLAELPKGQELSVLTTQGDWIWTYVERDGKRTKGWINAKLIARAALDGKADGNSDANVPDGMKTVGGEMSRADGDVIPGVGEKPMGPEVTPAAWESAAPPAPATPEPAEWERKNPDEMPRLFEFAGTRDLKTNVAGGAVGEIGRFEITGTEMSCAAVAPDGRLVVSGGDDALIRLWDAASGRQVQEFKGHEGGILSLAFSADGRQVLSGSADMSVRLWDVSSGEELHCFKGHEAEVISVSFAPGGRFATSTGRDKTLRMWKLPAATMHSQIEPPLNVIAHRPIMAASLALLAVEEQKPEPEPAAETEVPFAKPLALAGDLKLNTAGEIVAIDFRKSHATDATLQKLSRLERLETLYLYGPQVSDFGLESLKSLTQLKTLWLTRTNVTDAGLASLRELRHLESLVLTDCDGVTDAGLAHVAGMTELKDLWLNGTRITDSGLEHLARLSNLEMLVLPGTDAITDAGLKHLRGLDNLQDLWFNGANISDHGLTLVAQLSALQYVDAGQTRVTANGARRFHRQLPDCDLEF